AAVADRSDAGAADHREHLPPTAGILDNLHRNWTATLKAQSNVLSTWPRQCLARAELSRGQMISACAALNPDRTASSGTCVAWRAAARCNPRPIAACGGCDGS